MAATADPAASAASAAPVPARLPALSRLRLPAPVFVSDLHLCSELPHTVERFLALLAGLHHQDRELVILGDLFEYWPGDDSLDEDGPDDRLARAIVKALRELAESGTPIYVLHGNRDLLLGERFLRESGAQLLADPCQASLGPAGVAALLAHGDLFCTLDTRYQQWRAQARDPDFQALFLAQPLAQRRALLGQVRMQSVAGNERKPPEIMDVAAPAVEAALHQAGVHILIHGHTHRPARHELQVDGEPATRWVLTDWDLDRPPGRGGGLRWGESGLETFSIED